MSRDPTLQPKIDPPVGDDGTFGSGGVTWVRKEYPGAVEQLEFHNDEGSLFVDEDGELWFEHDVPTPALRWDRAESRWKEEV